jgi:hypothetical protein
LKNCELLATQEALFSTSFVNYDDDDDDNKHLTAEIHRVWNVKAKVISVITEETGTIPKSFI